MISHNQFAVRNLSLSVHCTTQHHASRERIEFEDSNLTCDGNTYLSQRGHHNNRMYGNRNNAMHSNTNNGMCSDININNNNEWIEIELIIQCTMKIDI